MKFFAIVFFGLLLMSSSLFANPSQVRCEVHDDTFVYKVEGKLVGEELSVLALNLCRGQSDKPEYCVAADELNCRAAIFPATNSQLDSTAQDFSISKIANGPPDGEKGASCTVFEGCSFPNRCVNGFCRAPGGGGGDCTVFEGCEFPNRCVNGFCRSPGGGGGQCTPFEGCKFPARCKNGWCVK